MTNEISSSMMTIIITILVIWELSWKGLALWRAGRRNDSTWFVWILVINSIGILPIIYLSITQKPKSSSLKKSSSKKSSSKKS